MNTHIFRTTWAQEGERLGALRRQVFVVEQSVPEELEWDEFDASADHFACVETQLEKFVGTGRVVRLSDRMLMGRLCVDKEFRRHSIATKLMHAMIEYCEEAKATLIELHAQLYLEQFYARFGFIAHGEKYLEAGIEHITMRKGVVS